MHMRELKHWTHVICHARHYETYLTLLVCPSENWQQTHNFAECCSTGLAQDFLFMLCIFMANYMRRAFVVFFSTVYTSEIVYVVSKYWWKWSYPHWSRIMSWWKKDLSQVIFLIWFLILKYLQYKDIFRRLYVCKAWSFSERSCLFPGSSNYSVRTQSLGVWCFQSGFKS